MSKITSSSILSDGKILLNDSIKVWFDANDGFKLKCEFDRSKIREMDVLSLISEYIEIKSKELQI